MSLPSNEPIYTISIAAEMLGISTHTLRLYEKEGLILPHRTKSKRRIYSDIEIAKIRSFRQLMDEEKLNFAALRHLLALIPCWLHWPEHMDTCNECPAFNNMGHPCWAAKDKCLHPMKNCRDCQVYLSAIDIYEIKNKVFSSYKRALQIRNN